MLHVLCSTWLVRHKHNEYLRTQNHHLFFEKEVEILAFASIILCKKILQMNTLINPKSPPRIQHHTYKDDEGVAMIMVVCLDLGLMHVI
jgi:hypothetical protein